MRRFTKLGQALEKGIGQASYFFLLLGGGLALLTAILTTYAVFRRYVLHNPEPYSYVIAVIFFFTCVFLPLAYVQKEWRNIRVDFMANYFTSKMQYILLNIVTPVLALFYVGIGTWQFWKTAWYSLQIGEISQQVLRVPLFPIKVMVPISWGLLCLVLIVQLYRGIITVTKGRFE